MSIREFKVGFSESIVRIVASHAEHNASVPPFNSSGDPLAYHKLCEVEYHHCDLVADWQVSMSIGAEDARSIDMCSRCLDDYLG